jgi:hypothetical protein
VDRGLLPGPLLYGHREGALIADHTEALGKLYREHLEDKPKPPLMAVHRSNAYSPNGSGPSDADVVEKLLGERTDKGRRLWEGDTSDYPSPSEADMGLLQKLAFYTQDPDQLDRLWLTSELAREKIEKRSALRLKTINKALEQVGDTFEWNPQTVSLGKAPTVEPERTGDGRTEAESTNGSAPALTNPFIRADLCTPLKKGVKPPEILVPEVLLAGKVHSIHSAGGTGKTFMMLYLVKLVVERGKRVVIFDLENGLRIIAERLELFGLTSEEASSIHYYPFPSMPMDPDVIRAFEDLLGDVDPALVVFDSWVNCLAACGLDENKSTDIAAWADAYSQKARLRGSAVLILDHVPKEGGSARGSGRKLDYVDVQFELRNPQPFDRETVGRVDLHLRKDREGWLPRYLAYSVGGGADGFVFKRFAGVFIGRDEEGLTPSERSTLEALQSFGDMGAFDKEWKPAAEVRGVSRSGYYSSKKKLLSIGLVEEDMHKFFIKSEPQDEIQFEEDEIEV